MSEALDDVSWLELTGESLDLGRAVAWVNGPRWGAVASFLGVVRSEAEERTGVTAIEYEAYEEQVVPRLSAMTTDVRERWGELGRIVIWHRTGLVALGEASVVVVVSAPHRAEAMEACRYLIDALKKSVPIWKKEMWPGGSRWSPAAHELAR